MDYSKKKLSKFNHNTVTTNLLHHDNSISNSRLSQFKSTTTQTEESSTFFNNHKINQPIYHDNMMQNTDPYVNKSYMNNYYDSVTGNSQNMMRTVPENYNFCPTCCRTFSTYCQQNQLGPSPYSNPWYPAYNMNNGYMQLGLPPPPFMPMPMVQGMLPYNTPNSYSNKPDMHMVTNMIGDNTYMRANIMGRLNESFSKMNVTEPYVNEPAENYYENAQCYSHSQPYRLQPPQRRFKQKTSNIRSEPNVTKYDIIHQIEHQVKQTEKNHSYNEIGNSDVINHNCSVKVTPKSDTWLATTDKYQKSDETNGDSVERDRERDQHILQKTNYILNKYNQYGNMTSPKFEKGDFNLSTYNKDMLKSPIYKYADIRIHELSSNLKDIKEDIVKLSTKASELNVNDPAAETEHVNLTKYFKSVYNELKDKDAISSNYHSNNSSLRNSTSNLNSSNFTTSMSSLYKNNSANSSDDFVNVSATGLYHKEENTAKSLNNNDVTRDSNHNGKKISSKHNEQFKELFNKEMNNDDGDNKNNQENYRNNSSGTNVNNAPNQSEFSQLQDQINIMKRTRPLYDIPSALNSNQNQCQMETKADNSNDQKNDKKVFKSMPGSPSVVKSKLRKIKSDKIMAHVLVPDRLSGSQSFDDSNQKEDTDVNKFSLMPKYGNIHKKKRFCNLSRRYANISFSINYDSLSDDEENNGNNKDTTATQSNNSDSALNENLIVTEKQLSRYFHIEPDGFNTYKELLETEDDEDSEYDVIDEDVCIDENEGGDNEKSMANSTKSSIMSIEKWLQKNAETLKAGEQKPIAIITSSPTPTKRHSQYGSLNNLEVLSKISEEDEERFNSIEANMNNKIPAPTKSNKIVNKDLLYCEYNNNKTITKAEMLQADNTIQVQTENEMPHEKQEIFLEQKHGNTWLH